MEISNLGLSNISVPVWVLLVVIAVAIPVIVCFVDPFKFVCKRKPNEKKSIDTKQTIEKDDSDDTKYAQ